MRFDIRGAVAHLFGGGSVRAQEATTAQSALTDENADLWHRVGSIRDGARDLPPVNQDRAIQLAHDMYQRDGVVGRVVGHIRAHVMGEGVTVQSLIEDEGLREKHQALIDEQWKDRQTKWPRRVKEVVEFLWLLGEQLHTEHVQVSTGRTAWGYIDPAAIDAGGVIGHPEDARRIMGILLKSDLARPTFLPTTDERELEAEEEGMEGALQIPATGSEWVLPGRRDGGRVAVLVGRDCIYSAQNKPPSARRGVSNIYRVVDKLDAYDRFMQIALEGNEARNMYAFWARVRGGDPETAKVEKMLRAQMGKFGGIAVTNQNVEDLKTLTPDLKTADYVPFAQELRRQIAGELGFPETWFADGSSAGNASTTELAGPTLTMLREYQEDVRELLDEMFGRGLKHRAEVDAPELLKDDAWNLFEIRLPKIGGRDAVRESTVHRDDTITLGAAVDAGFVTRKKEAAQWQDLTGKRWGTQFTEADTPGDDFDANPMDADFPSGGGEKGEGADTDPDDAPGGTPQGPEGLTNRVKEAARRVGRLLRRSA